MSKYNKIYVKIQVEKDQDSGDLLIKAYFNPDAPNFFYDKKEISWIPTSEEMEFINEAFELIPQYKAKDKHFENKPKKKKESLPLFEHEEAGEEPFENVDQHKDTKESDSESPTDKKEISEGVVVTSDSGTIDKILKRKQEDSDRNFVEADEDVIIDKVLKGKKKGKW